MHLTDDVLPSLFKAADATSVAAQRKFLRFTIARLLALVLAAFFGINIEFWQRWHTDWAGIFAAIAFGVALIFESYILRSRPDRIWYEGRAAAESVKSLSWRYAVGGAPFALHAPVDNLDRVFLQQLDELLKSVQHLPLKIDNTVESEISQAMRQLRSSPLANRKAAYKEDRVINQQKWYVKEHEKNERRAFWWSGIALFFEVLGLVSAVLKVADMLEADWLGLAAAIVAGVTAWVQTKQHTTLAVAYSAAALRFGSLRSQIDDQNNEPAWAAFVDTAEQEFAREQSLWQASRGARLTAN